MFHPHAVSAPPPKHGQFASGRPFLLRVARAYPVFVPTLPLVRHSSAPSVIQSSDGASVSSRPRASAFVAAPLHVRTTGCRMSRRLASRAFGLVPRRASHLFNPSTYLTLGVTALGPSSILPQLRLLKLSFAPPPATHRSLIFTSELSGPRLTSPPSFSASSEPHHSTPPRHTTPAGLSTSSRHPE